MKRIKRIVILLYLVLLYLAFAISVISFIATCMLTTKEIKVHAAQEELTNSDIQAAFESFKTYATSHNESLNPMIAGTEQYQISVQDYYQVYMNADKTDAILICTVKFNNKLYKIKVYVLIDYYPGMQRIFNQLDTIKEQYPEYFLRGQTAVTPVPQWPSVTENPNEHEQTGPATPNGNEDVIHVKHGVGVDENNDGVFDYFIEPDGLTTYMPEQFDEDLTFCEYVIAHLDLYKSYIEIDSIGAVYWKQTGEQIGYAPDGGATGIN